MTNRLPCVVAVALIGPVPALDSCTSPGVI
jgi:hypothetical protein